MIDFVVVLHVVEGTGMKNDRFEERVVEIFNDGVGSNRELRQRIQLRF
jgi:hypothetical protein